MLLNFLSYSSSDSPSVGWLISNYFFGILSSIIGFSWVFCWLLGLSAIPLFLFRHVLHRHIRACLCLSQYTFFWPFFFSRFSLYLLFLSEWCSWLSSSSLFNSSLKICLEYVSGLFMTHLLWMEYNFLCQTCWSLKIWRTLIGPYTFGSEFPTRVCHCQMKYFLWLHPSHH